VRAWGKTPGLLDPEKDAKGLLPTYFSKESTKRTNFESKLKESKKV
jgi:hypothetical protein